MLAYVRFKNYFYASKNTKDTVAQRGDNGGGGENSSGANDEGRQKG